ncbi:NAD(P)-binding protein [Porticoccus sp.]|nr:NAD(P)-binding protein [Porticoccus sp.]
MIQHYVVAGGGIAGILSALLLRKYYPNSKITLIESNNKLGGLLRSFDYGENGLFDYGTHYLMESGILDVDDLFESVLPLHERHIMSGYQTDISGAYRNGKLQNNSPCIDIRSHPDCAAYIKDFIHNFQNLNSENPPIKNAKEYYERRYGKKITADFIAPIILKIFKKSLESMSYMGTRFFPLSRLIMMENKDINSLDPLVKNCVAHTDQRNTSFLKQTASNAFYSQKRGIGLMIKGFVEMMHDQSINILYNNKVSSIEIKNACVKSILVTSKDKEDTVKIDIDLFVSATGVIPLTSLFNIDGLDIRSLDMPMTTVLVHLNISKPLQTKGLYYFYCYDEGYHSFRITDYRNYCPQAQDDGDNGKGYPVTVEMVFENNTKYTDIDFSNIAINELKKMGVVKEKTDVLFKKSEKLSYGFPLLTVQNDNVFADVRSHIQSLKLKNFVSCGALSETDVYFQSDIINDVHKKISSLSLPKKQIS